jgi:hypothetical protein
MDVEGVSSNEIPELIAAATFWARHLALCVKTATHTQIKSFRDTLLDGIKKRVEGHWYDDDPTKGQGYRALICAESIDRLLLEAAKQAQLSVDFRKLFPNEVVMYIDPGNVSVKYFTPNSRNCQVQIIYPANTSSRPEAKEQINEKIWQNGGKSSPVSFPSESQYVNDRPTTPPRTNVESVNANSTQILQRRNSMSPPNDSQFYNNANLLQSSGEYANGNNFRRSSLTSNTLYPIPEGAYTNGNNAGIPNQSFQRRGSLNPLAEIPFANENSTSIRSSGEYINGNSIWAKSSTESTNKYVAQRRDSLNPTMEMPFVNGNSNLTKLSGEFVPNYNNFQRRSSLNPLAEAYVNKENMNMLKSSGEYIPLNFRRNSLVGNLQNYPTPAVDMAQAFVENRKLYENAKLRQVLKSSGGYPNMGCNFGNSFGAHSIYENENLMLKSGGEQYLGHLRRHSINYPGEATF